MIGLRRPRAVVVALPVALALVVGAIPAPGPAAAGPDEEAAREATRKGTAAFNLGHFEEAARHYEEAYRLVQDPSLLYNIGQSFRLAGRPERALAPYKAYLRTTKAGAPNRAQVERWIAEIERSAAGRDATGAPPQPPPAAGLEAAPATVLEAASATGLVSAPAAAAPPRRRYWLWGAVAIAVAGGIAAAIVLSSGGAPGPDVPATPLGNRDLFR